ncbi:MraY family glycosyltransferase [Holzapfeliella sp. He02]|uniref:MraY family glycosyltransferase n=1 Tax=Holzapfeliella saturejae TaxID=3082953 RepID=A0ABU8SFV4_9LACO
MYNIIVNLFLTVIISAFITPFVRRLAFVLGAVDNPNARRVNKKPMPTIGGLSLFITFSISTFVLLRNQFPTHELFGIFLAASVIILTGIVDDIRELKPRYKMIGMILAAVIIYLLAGVRMVHFYLPFVGLINLGWLSFPITIFWILAFTNAVNLIDGLDGLAAGVSMISLLTMGIIGFFFLVNTDAYVSLMAFVLVAALIGFLPYNFHPAKIFLGDTGALFLGFMIAVLSLKGLKNVTLISSIVPIVILGVPITDTIYAMLRRILNKKPISQADKHHLHHQLMQMGFTHRQTVLAIYGISLIFAFCAMLFVLSPAQGVWFLLVAVAFALEIFVESIGLMGPNRKPLLSFIRRKIQKNNHNDKVVSKMDHKIDKKNKS